MNANTDKNGRAARGKTPRWWKPNPNLGRSPKAVGWASHDVIRLQRQLFARNGDLRPIEDGPLHIWRLPVVMERLGLSERQIYKLIEHGELPKPLVLDRNPPRTQPRAD